MGNSLSGLINDWGYGNIIRDSSQADGMGDRGSKSVIFQTIAVKEQRVDGSSITWN